MAGNFPPIASDFQAQFSREFIYGTGLDSVKDSDINRALNEAGIMFNSGLWDTTTAIGSSNEGAIAYLYLAAHLMVLNIQQMAGGLSAVPRGKGVRNSAEGVAVASGIGAANVTYQVPPPRVAENAILLDFFRTTFGQRYMAMIEPRLIGNVAVVSGRSPWNSGGFGQPPGNIDPGPVI